MDYSKYVKFYPDFPIKGVNFVDIIPFLQDKALFSRPCATPPTLPPPRHAVSCSAPACFTGTTS